ncbi:synaptic vesicle glycoprotein 2B [Aethina tumida]|uniref:synaptic vesicle glycoprotein 2B n=1 Tax=Aethina tumida TaxID=116153 RepID=UPI00214916B7|nr:synaptic vesicle glycoprotein 2B [Aethina tumida]
MSLPTNSGQFSGEIKNSNSEDNVVPERRQGFAHFEEAVEACSFGKFNVFLLLVAIPSAMSPVFESSTMSYVLPVAECDLNLSLQNKGMLNAITFGGMIVSGLFWGYLCDTLGRKKLLCFGFILNGIFVIISSLSQNFVMLMICKFLGGFIINGPFSALTCYLTEFHGAKYRSRIQIGRGMIISAANIVLPLLAWAILPKTMHFPLFNRLDINSWNIFLLICSLPPLISGLIFAFMPESPKFLMAMGRNEEALKIFRTVYRINTGKSEDSYPIKELVDEIIEQKEVNINGLSITPQRTKVQALKEGWLQIKPIFFPPYLSKLILVCGNQFFLMMVVNTLKLWVPQIFQSINDFKQESNSSFRLCEVIDSMTPKNKSQTCSVNLDNSSVYINSIIIAAIIMLVFALAAALINKLGQKVILLACYLIAGGCSVALYFSADSISTLSLYSTFISFGMLGSNLMQTVTLDLFPTTNRSITLSILMMIGRTGIISGNLIFPTLLYFGCGSVFFSAGGVLLCMLCTIFFFINLFVFFRLCHIIYSSPKYTEKSFTVIIYVILYIFNTYKLYNTKDFILQINLMSVLDNTPADFELAISETGFGKFNFLLYFLSVSSGWSSIFETTTMSYVFPAAQCDLELTLSNKGLLNSITYIGMISSAFIWGFLCDTLGRRKLLFIGFLLDGCFVLMSAMSQSFTGLIITKFLGGFIINGPFAALTCYLSEFHCAKHRARVQMVLGTIFSCGTVILPLLAWGILPQTFNITIGESFKLHSWNIYLLICSIPALTSGIAFLFLPETPKFLMTSGQNEKAMRIFKKVYSINTGKHPDTYPIKMLIDETASNDNNKTGQVTKRSKKQALLEGWSQISPLFKPPHLSKIMLVCCIQFLFMMSLNTLRLWLPQLFQAINDYMYMNNGTTDSLCTMIDVLRPNHASVTTECVVNTNNYMVYMNSMIVAFTSIWGYIITGSLINILGKKKILNVLGFISGSMAISLYFAQDATTTLVLSSLFIALGSVSVNVVLAVVVDMFPTTLRTMCISLTMMSGRCGPMLGNLVFPLLLQTGCASPFFSIGFVMIGCAILACLLPNTDMKSLE